MFKKGQFFGFGTPVEVNVTFNDAHTRKRINVTKFNEATQQNERETLYLFTDKDPIQGQVIISTPSKRVDYTSVLCELIGQITIENDTKEVYEFSCVKQQLDGEGSVEDTKVLEYNFECPKKEHESYTGINAQLRYFIRVTLARSYAPNIIEEQDFWVQNVQVESEINNSIKMEVGIEDCLHIEFEYNKAKYHLNDVVLGNPRKAAS